MLTGVRALSCALLLAACVAVTPASPAMAQDASWKVSKSSGEVFIDAPGAQPAALSADAVLTPGATVRTGSNGRVLLIRGAETIMVSPNSVIQVPADKSGGMTSILQRSGSVVFDVEKKNVRHFEVSTPYLAAVVKGTQFRVTVDEAGSHVDVLRGQVQVTDFKSGQRVLVNPSQTATVALRDGPGLKLGGSGPLSPIEYGSPQVPPVSPVTAPVTTPATDAAAPATAPTTTPAAAPAPVRSAAAMAPPSPLQGPAPAIAATRWSQPGNVKDSLWSSSSASNDEGILAWLRDKLGIGRQRKAQDDMTIVAVPIAVGLSVIVGAMMVRRRRNKPEDRRDRA